LNKSVSHNKISKLSIAGVLITLGIIYGDLGTSPLYVMKAIISGNKNPDVDFILGAISCIFWTLTLQTTFKYIFITLRADNKGEGGIFSLYALIRRRAKGVFIFAIIGGSALLADGVITPSITVVSAVEGLENINPSISVIPIVIVIITALFFVQQYGTVTLGKSFGPIMFAWFLMLGVLGVSQIVTFPSVFKAFNPVYAYHLLADYPYGFLLLGAVFLCTTGAEALYSDLGHCGIKNIRVSWIYVKLALILNYLGQGAWIINNSGHISSSTNPFYAIMPGWFMITGVVAATMAAIIASQALITGAYTIISEAIQLNFWPKVKINYPTNIKGQMYVPSINWLLYAACIFVICYFRSSAGMEAAYGLSITLAMLMTTILLAFYLRIKRSPAIEVSFLVANLNKFSHGGWVTILIAGVLSSIMYIWYRGFNIKRKFTEFDKIDNYKEVLIDLNKDASLPKYATNLVYLTRSPMPNEVETKIMYSIINKQPKRADVYWFIHLHVVDEPFRTEYKVQSLIPNIMYRVDFWLGFRDQPRINLFFKKVVAEMDENNEIDLTSRYTSLRQHNVRSDFRFVVIDRIQTYDFDFSPVKQFIMDIYSFIKRFGISDVKAFGLDSSNVTVENVPFINPKIQDIHLTRINEKKS
jgi:KUP system potassium uptake protein